MFGSPLCYCPLCGDWVALDQSLEECARRDGCGGRRCPLQQYLEPALSVNGGRKAAGPVANASNGGFLPGA